MDEIEDEQLHVVRVAAVDVGKGALEVCIRVPSETITAAASAGGARVRRDQAPDSVAG